VNKVVPVDKSSTVLTIVLAFVFLGERVSLATAAAVASIGLGTLMMVERRDVAGEPGARRGGWLPFVVLSAVFASLTALLGKVGIEGVESNLGTAVRCVVVLAMAWLVVLARGKGGLVRASPRGELGFLCLSGLATGGSWLCYFRALQEGPASVVVPVEKLSVLVSIGFAFVVFRERLTRKGFAGLCLVTAGTLAMVAL
jgi:predicted membrane protein